MAGLSTGMRIYLTIIALVLMVTMTIVTVMVRASTKMAMADILMKEIEKIHLKHWAMLATSSMETFGFALLLRFGLLLETFGFALLLRFGLL